MWQVRDKEEIWMMLRFLGEQVNVSIFHRDGYFFKGRFGDT